LETNQGLQACTPSMRYLRSTGTVTDTAAVG
jgi:hypothetical protein